MSSRRRPLPLPLSSPRPVSAVSLDHESASRFPRPSREHPLSSPPTISSFHIPAIPAPSPPSHTATHAGGILPSASFFRPSRPAHSRPASPASPSLPPPDRPSDSDLRRISDSPSLRRLATLKRSREPLLPSKPSDPRPTCASLTRVWRNLSLDSAPDEVTLSTARQSLHHSHSTSPPPRQSMFHPLVQIPPSRPPSSSPSPNNIFIPHPPKSFPPLSAVPLAPQKHIYQLYPSRNRFFCAGRLLTGGDSPWAFIASFAVVVAISATWFSTTCVWWWHNESPAVAAVGAYMCLLTISCMLATVSAPLPSIVHLPYPS